MCTQLDRLDLMAIERVAFEDIGQFRMQGTRLRKARHAACNLESGVELKQRFRPKLSMAQFTLDMFPDLGIGNIEKTMDVSGVVLDDLGMRVEDVHVRFIAAGGG